LDRYAAHALRWLQDNTTAEPIAQAETPATRVVELNGVRHEVGAVASPSPLPKFDDRLRGTFTDTPAEFEQAYREAVSYHPLPDPLTAALRPPSMDPPPR
jgi:hypothetical protein